MMNSCQIYVQLYTQATNTEYRMESQSKSNCSRRWMFEIKLWDKEIPPRHIPTHTSSTYREPQFSLLSCISKVTWKIDIMWEDNKGAARIFEAPITEIAPPLSPPSSHLRKNCHLKGRGGRGSFPIAKISLQILVF